MSLIGNRIADAIAKGIANRVALRLVFSLADDLPRKVVLDMIQMQATLALPDYVIGMGVLPRVDP